ncbi:hypothetical protein WJ96_06415 [Burkholderia ubonensis]|uniref:Uncharacterized protein n=1 Tax=Burkholderia ubonensis TaxID=101571 RepID=A0AAW3MW94_9BURK|nr:hypothetical protein [Burkholderia ubonensis]KVP75392.1 hypothetical protein WJ93_08220 [Burkholderia ubonensis]KVP96856.1 hypothetical protein WJ97_13330 [Burkholderia ubonensis]KVP98203.1 hypothetical protein WJ96_06415 [Burkholderia ubonensis]KVZ92901.1 hypothetical protein WL25_18080 [Burkholderia ubonensis]
MSELNTTPAAEETAEEARKAQLRAQLAKGQEKMRELRASGWKPVHRNPVEQAEANPKSLKAAIKAFCWTCVGADADPGAKFRVRDCSVTRCSLHPHRPWQAVKGGELVTGQDGELLGSDETEDTSDE